MENINGNAMPAFDPLSRHPDLESAKAYLASHGQAEAFAAIADQGEYILIALSGAALEKAKAPPKAPKKAKGKAEAKAKGKAPKKAEAPKAEAPKGKQGSAKRIAAQGDLKPKAEAKGFVKRDTWAKLSERQWIGPWGELMEKAAKGTLPEAPPAKSDLANTSIQDWPKAASGFGGIFKANTHWPFRKRIAALAALIRARDLAGLRKHDIKQISTTPIMLSKLRDLAIAALSAKAEKAKGNGKGEAPQASPAEAPQA